MHQRRCSRVYYILYYIYPDLQPVLKHLPATQLVQRAESGHMFCLAAILAALLELACKEEVY